MHTAPATRPRPRLRAAVHDPPVGACQLVILDGSFLGGKDWIHKETSLTDAENPAFNVYSTNAAAHKVGMGQTQGAHWVGGGTGPGSGEGGG